MAYGNLKLYNRCPPWVRSLAASAYGMATRSRRCGAAYERFSRELEASQWEPTADLLRRARGAAERYAGSAIEEVPILSKEDLRREPERFLTPAPGAHERQTSGTTGKPLRILVTPEAYQREYAFVWQHRAWHGCPRGSRTATFAGHPVAPPSRGRPPFWIHNRSEDQLIFSSYHMSPATLPHYVRALVAFRPALVHGYPSSLALVAAAMLENRARFVPRAVLTASETLLPHQRSLLREAFGVEPRVWYGNTEQAGNIVECPSGRLHVREEHSYVELTRDDGRPAAPAEAARLVVTAFANPATRLVRYDTGDLAVLSSETHCPCGRAGRLVERILGRVEDYVVDAAGRLVGRLDHLFKEARGVREAQLVQEVPGEILVRIVPEGRPGPDLEGGIRAEAERRLSQGTRLVFEYVDRLEREPSGKVRFVVSRLPGSTPGLHSCNSPNPCYTPRCI